MNDDSSVGEEMLHAYVDAALSPADIARVDAWLAAHPADAATVAAWRHQNTLVREVFGDAAVAARGGIGKAPADAGASGPLSRRRAGFTGALAASLAAFVVGLGAGIGVSTLLPSIRAEARTIAEQATTAYRVYSVEKRHPVEVGADEREHLVRWLSNRLEAPLALPDLDDQGLALIGGRLTATDRGPAALFMFEAANGDRYTVYVTRASRSGETPFRFDIAGDVGACYWLDRDLAVVVNGPADRDRLQAIADRVYAAYESAARPGNGS